MGYRTGDFAPTDDERTLKRLDDGGGEVVGFLIHEVSTLEQGAPVEVEDEAPVDEVVNIMAKQAAIRVDVSVRRVRQLARNVSFERATKSGSKWLIPTPVEFTPGERTPSPLRGRAESSGFQGVKK